MQKLKVVAVLSALILSLQSASALACYTNGEIVRLAKQFTSKPESIREASTDRLHDWSKEMGTYIFFRGDGKEFGGYATFDQWTCKLKFSDIRELSTLEVIE